MRLSEFQGETRGKMEVAAKIGGGIGVFVDALWRQQKLRQFRRSRALRLRSAAADRLVRARREGRASEAREALAEMQRANRVLHAVQ